MDSGIIEKYAIAGGIAHFYYIEPSVTYDLDLVVSVPGGKHELSPLGGIYNWARENNYKAEEEHIIIEGIPVQFLLAYNELVSEALEHRVEISLFEEKTFILEAEYLMAIMLQTGRASDRERLVRFLTEVDYNNDKFMAIISRFKLMDKYHKFRKKYED